MKTDNEPLISFCLAVSNFNASKAPMIVSFNFHNLHHYPPVAWLTIFEEFNSYSLKSLLIFYAILTKTCSQYAVQISRSPTRSGTQI